MPNGDDEDGEWLTASELKVGQKVLRPDGLWTRITSIERSTEPTIVYNLEVEGNHNYFVGEIGVLSHNCGIWSSIKAMQPVYKGSFLPKSFEIATSNGSFWVSGRATEHIADYLNFVAKNHAPETVRLTTQVTLESLGAAINAAAKQGIKYDEIIEIGGWQLKFGASKEAGGLPALYHARQLKKSE